MKSIKRGMTIYLEDVRADRLAVAAKIARKSVSQLVAGLVDEFLNRNAEPIDEAVAALKPEKLR